MATNMPSEIQSFVYFDLEGTGLPSQPADYPVRIMELSMVAVQRPQAQRQHLQTTLGAGLAHLPAAERGLVTPKRRIREDDRLGGAGPSRGRPRPRLVGLTTPPASDDTDDEDDERDEPGTPVSVPTPPRVRNALLLTVSPRKPIAAIVTDITELDNELLEPHSAFDRDLANMVLAYLKRLPAPVCLVAHNGNRYDFPLLKAELLHADPTWFDSNELLCADSLAFFRAVAAGRDGAQPNAGDATVVYALDSTTLSCGHEAQDDFCIVCNPSMWLPHEECDTNADFEFTRVAGRRAIRCLHDGSRRCVVCENVPHHRRPPPRARRQLFTARRTGDGGGGRTPSMTLPNVYQRRFGVPMERNHNAADDVEALLLLCLSYGERFSDWADRNSSPLRTVKEMWARRAPPQAARYHRTLPVW